jgi:hypothetical protein
MFEFVVDGERNYIITYSIELSRNRFRTIERVEEQSIDHFGWIDRNDNVARAFNIGDVARYKLQKEEIVVGNWQWRVRAKNQYGFGPYSDMMNIHVGYYEGNFKDVLPQYTNEYADTFLTGINNWYFFLERQDSAYVYWTNGEVCLKEGMFVIQGTNNKPVDPTKLPAYPSLTVTPNSEWWMVLKWRSDITQFSVSNESIRFVDKDKLDELWLEDPSWVPVLFFPSGNKNKVPAKGSSVLTYSYDNYPLDNDLEINDMVLKDHVDNIKIHSGEAFNVPVKIMGYVDKDHPALFTINNYTQDAIHSRGLVGKSHGIGMLGISSKKEFVGTIVDKGIGLYAHGDYADVIMKNGKLHSRHGTIQVGTEEDPVSIIVNHTEEEQDGCVGNNVSKTTAGTTDGYLLPMGIKVTATGNNGVAAVGRSNFIGVMAKGVTADILLKHKGIKTKEGKGNLNINGGILNHYALLKEN